MQGISQACNNFHIVIVDALYTWLGLWFVAFVNDIDFHIMGIRIKTAIFFSFDKVDNIDVNYPRVNWIVALLT